MPARLPERRSALARWSARLAFVSIPILIIVAVGHRAGLMSATEAYAVMAVGFALAGLAILAAIASLEAIWRDGRRGLGSAIQGLAIGLIVLLVPLLGAWKLAIYPRLIDISTNVENPPVFVLALLDRPDDARLPEEFTADQATLQRQAYPDLVSRYYPVGPARVFDDARAIVEARGWRPLGIRPPSGAAEIGRIEAVASTLVFGFQHDVVIRIVPDGEGALVDMRSAARNGDHDLGVNAERIRDFFAALDSSLQGISEEE